MTRWPIAFIPWGCLHRRAKGMLVICDEIFAGLWRLGSPSAWERLHIVPDIACYAKLLTGDAHEVILQPEHGASWIS